MHARGYSAPAVARVAAATAVFVLASACTNAQSPTQKSPHTGVSTASSDGGTQQIVISAGPDLRFHPSTIVVHPGRVRIVLHNTAQAGEGAPHNISVPKYSSADVPITSAGERQSVSFIAPAPGRYRFVCTFHVAQGQTGTLIVEKPSSK